MPQLSSHPEVAAQATMLLVQAANNPDKGSVNKPVTMDTKQI